MDVDVFIESTAGVQQALRLRPTGPISIGRDSTSTVFLDSDVVSRTHVVIDVVGQGLRVEDRSSNGTLAGDVLLRRRSIDVPYGTPIVVGNYTVYVSPAGMMSAAYGQALPPPPPPPPPPVIPPPRGTQPGQPVPSTRGGSQPPPLPTEARNPPTPTKGTIPAPPPLPNGGPPMVAPHPMGAAPEAPPEGPKKPTAKEDEAFVSLRRDIHAKLLENLDLAQIDARKMDDPSMRPRVLAALRRIVTELDARIAPAIDRNKLIGDLVDEALGLGPLERFLSDPSISEIMVIDPSNIYIEQKGKLILSDARFTDDERVRAVIERIVTPLGRRIDESSPLVDARLKDGSRVNAVIRPIALRGSAITIRKFARTPLTLDNLIKYGALTEQVSRFLIRCVIAKKNVVISGGTGSGKTTLLNILSGAIPADERIITIEDAAELQLRQPHVVSLETRPANMEGKGEYTIRDLVKNSLRMRPDRIVVGECRGGEALDMLQAMNTGHDGSMTTTHANSPQEALTRIETLVLMAGVDLPSRAIRDQIANSIHIITQIARFADGTRRLTHVSEVTGIEDGEILTRNIFEYVRTGTGPDGKVLGYHRATGYLPSFLDDFIVQGLVKRGEPYL